jgi:type I restriction enzyme S subunit
MQTRVSALQLGTTRKRISRRNLGTIEFPVPPLNEQRRIVAAIEERFSRLDAAAASLTVVERRLDALQRASLASISHEEWPVVRLAEVTESQIYGTSQKASDDARGVAVLRMGNIQAGRIDFSNLKYLPPGHPDVEKLALRPGDLLFNRTNSPELVGKAAVFTGHPEPVIFASYLIRVRLASDCLPEWAALQVNGPIGRQYIAEVRTQQVGQANVNGTKLSAMPIPLPPLYEQRRIVAEVEQRLSMIGAMRATIEVAERRSVALRRSILERAFQGQLVPQDPSDEPATVLIERIQANRAETERDAVQSTRAKRDAALSDRAR